MTKLGRQPSRKKDRNARDRGSGGADKKRPEPGKSKRLQDDRAGREAGKKCDRVDRDNAAARFFARNGVDPRLAGQPRQREAGAHQKPDGDPGPGRLKGIEGKEPDRACQTSTGNSRDRA